MGGVSVYTTCKYFDTSQSVCCEQKKGKKVANCQTEPSNGRQWGVNPKQAQYRHKSDGEGDEAEPDDCREKQSAESSRWGSVGFLREEGNLFGVLWELQHQVEGGYELPWVAMGGGGGVPGFFFFFFYFFFSFKTGLHHEQSRAEYEKSTSTAQTEYMRMGRVLCCRYRISLCRAKKSKENPPTQLHPNSTAQLHLLTLLHSALAQC